MVHFQGAIRSKHREGIKFSSFSDGWAQVDVHDLREYLHLRICSTLVWTEPGTWDLAAGVGSSQDNDGF